MQIIPAIDIIEGKCVRLSQGDYAQKKIYDLDPIEVAKSFEDLGIKKIHLVDLDGAKAKQVINFNILEEIAIKTKLEIEFGGGVKSDADLQKVFDSGATQAIIGTVAVTSPDLFFNWLDRYGQEKIILGADVKNERLAVNGWLEMSDLSIYDYLRNNISRGLKHVICTDISKDGMLGGTSVELYEKLINQFPELHIIASGGVASMQDILALKNIACQSVVVGKAIYEEKINLRYVIEQLNN